MSYNFKLFGSPVKKTSEPVSMNQFLSLLKEANKAYRRDVSYSIAMCNAARSVESKREVWKLRLELREASKKAQAKCRKADSFVCDNEAPCGLGSCKFAKGDLVLLQIVSPGNTVRPQIQSKGTYGLESVVEPLRELRTDSTDSEV